MRKSRRETIHQLRLALSTVVGLALTLLTGQLAQAAIPVTNCSQNLDVPGGHYALTGDLTCTDLAVTGVLISANGVKFDLNGFRIFGPDDGSGVGIQVGDSPVSGVRISGGDGSAVRGFGVGINLSAVSNSRVTGITVTGNFQGITIQSSANNNISGNTISNNTSTGVLLGDSANNRFATNTVTNNGGQGYILQFGSDGNVIVANDISLNTNQGVLIQNDSNGNTILNSVISNTSGALPIGVGVTDSSDNLIRGNTVNENVLGIRIAVASALATGNIVQNNTVNDNSSSGIAVFSGATGNTIQANTALGNDVQDLFDENLPSCVNTWKNNTFATDNEGDGPGAGCIQ
jgi:parallel beta-helix repeat protein